MHVRLKKVNIALG